MGHYSIGVVQNGTFGIGQADLRKYNRRRVLQSGSLVINNGLSLFDCIVRNVSAKGALVELDDPNFLPSSFEFHVAGSDQRIQAKTIWKKNKKVGIAYT